MDVLLESWMRWNRYTLHSNCLIPRLVKNSGWVGPGLSFLYHGPIWANDYGMAILCWFFDNFVANLAIWGPSKIMACGPNFGARPSPRLVWCYKCSTVSRIQKQYLLFIVTIFFFIIIIFHFLSNFKNIDGIMKVYTNEVYTAF